MPKPSESRREAPPRLRARPATPARRDANSPDYAMGENDPEEAGEEGEEPELGGDPAAAKRIIDAIGLEFAPASYDPAAGEVDVVFSTGASVRRYDWWEDQTYFEVLDVAGCDLSRLNSGAPLLTDHDAQVASVVGSVVPGSARIEKAQAVARVRFDRSSEAGQAVEAKVAGGHLRFVSCGYWVTEWEKVESEGKPTVWTARAWTPAEISLVAVPADAGAGTRSAAPAEAPPHLSTTRGTASHSKEARMPKTIEDQGAPAPAKRTAEAPQAATLQQLKDIATRAKLDADWTLRQLEAGITETEALRAAVDDVAARSTAKPLTATVEVTRDGGETRMAGIEGWLMHRCDPQHHKLEGPAMECRGMSLLDMARESLEVHGTRTRGMTPTEIAKRALGLPVGGFMTRGMGTTSDFPNLLANAQSKRLLTAYSMETRNYTAWARRRDLPDFKTARTIELGASPTLRPLAEGGNIEFGVMGEGGEQWSLVRLARNTALTYVAIVNDDLGGFDRLPQAFAQSALNYEASTVYGILGANANMADGNPLFGTTRTVTVDGTVYTQNNSTSGALSVDNYQAVRTLILRMRDATGQQMVTQPRILIVPTELEAAALALFSTLVVPNGWATTQVNPFRGQAQVVASQFLTDNNDWFVTVESGTGYEAVEYGYEQGMNGPDLSSYLDPEVDGVVFSCRHSFGAKAVTFRTIARSSN